MRMTVRTVPFVCALALLAGACGGNGLHAVADAGGTPDAPAADVPTFDAPALEASAPDVHAEARPPHPGLGCGKSLPAQTNMTTANQRFTKFTVMANGANLTSTPVEAKAIPRTFWVRVPADYDPQRPYRVVLNAPGCTTAGMAYQYALQLFRTAGGGTEQAIYVAIDDAPDMNDVGCYDNDGLRAGDWELFDLTMSFVDQHYCADLDKVYAVGYGTGAVVANRWGCYFAAPEPARQLAPSYHVSAQVALWGNEPPEQPACSGPVPAFFMRGTLGALSPINQTAPSLARVGGQNGCDTAYDDSGDAGATGANAPWHAADLPTGLCHTFTGCPTAAPVILCRPTVPAQVGAFDSFSIPAITKFFDELETLR